MNTPLIDTSKVRQMTFGKYKGRPVLWVIAAHIGYIMWCFENIKWFALNDDEQKFYDWQAIAIKKYGKQMTFPVENVYKHVKDTASLESLKTPFQFIGDDPYLPETEISDLLREAGAIKDVDESDSYSHPWWLGLQHTAMKMIDGMSEEEIEEMESYGIRPPMPPIY